MMVNVAPLIVIDESYGVRRLGEPGPPQFVTDHSDAIAVWNAIFIGMEEAAAVRMQAKQWKEIAEDDSAIDFFRVAADCDEQRRRQ